MTKGFWIWKDRLTDVLTAISDKADTKLNETTLDEIKYGLVGTSEEKGYWFDYQIGDITLKLSVDDSDNDIVIFKVMGLEDKEITRLSTLGTEEMN